MQKDNIITVLVSVIASVVVSVALCSSVCGSKAPAVSYTHLTLPTTSRV